MSAAQEFQLTAPEPRELVAASPTPMDLLTVALNNNAAIDVIERLAALQEKALARDAEQQFNEAMNAAQAEIGRIAPNKTNTQTNSKWATYAKLDSVLRPIYIKHGFSLSFNGCDSPADTVRAICYVSHRAGHTRTYMSPAIPADGKGAKGSDVMTKTHATGAAMSYGQRYLLKYIFNVAIGEDDTDGNLDNDWVMDALEYLENASAEELKPKFDEFYKKARSTNHVPTIQALVKAKDKRKKELGL